MSTYAHIEAGHVTSIIEADDEYIASKAGQWVECTDARGRVMLGCAYDEQGDVFMQPEPLEVGPLPTAHSEAVAEIERTRDAALLAGVTLHGVLWHSDEPFRADLTDMLLGYQLGLLTGTQLVRAMDNTMHQLTQAQIVELKFAVGMNRRAVFQASWDAKDALPGA